MLEEIQKTIVEAKDEIRQQYKAEAIFMQTAIWIF